VKKESDSENEGDDDEDKSDSDDEMLGDFPLRRTQGNMKIGTPMGIRPAATPTCIFTNPDLPEVLNFGENPKTKSGIIKKSPESLK
jgi:hypothetical protein